MKTKIFRGNQYISSFVCDGKSYTRLQLYTYLAVRTLKRSIIALAVICVLMWSIVLGGHLMPVTAYAERIVEVTTKSHAPVMDRIAKCESNDTHINPKTGQVYMLANSNKTVDVGKYMINTVWHKKAKELGLDITKEEDNEKMAYWIYENVGTSPWIYTANCWQK